MVRRRTTTNAWKPLEAFWPARELLRDSDRLIPEIENRYREAHPNNEDAGPGDVRSWRESVYWLASLLDRVGLDQVWMFVEYRVGAMNPVDVVLAGYHPNGGLSYAVIELKQWSQAGRPQPNPAKGLCAECRRAGTGALCGRCALDLVYVDSYGRNKKHPAVQVYENMQSLKVHHAMFDDRYVHLAGASYLHNLKDPDSQWIRNVSPRPGVPTFTARVPRELEEFLKATFSAESGAGAAEALLERRRTSSLIDSDVGAVVAGHTRFSLVENQLTAVKKVTEEVASPSTGAKKVFVVSGRAGSGKSLVGLTLLGWALSTGRNACYVSGGVASRETFKRAALGRRSAFATLNSIADNRTADELDLILCDEAHRLTERPMKGSYSMRPGESSVSVVVTRAKVPVFFIDGDQRLFSDEVWSPEALLREVQSLGAEVVPISLDRVLRAVGSSTYDTWIRRLLAEDPLPWRPDDRDEPEPFQLCYTDSASTMERFLQDKERNKESARMSAGICWKWEDRSGTDPEVAPEPGWARPWNAGDQHDTPGVPKRRYWATEPGGFGQIGCVHTAQGLEYEWGGVIMGPDLTWNGVGWQVHREHVLSKASRIREEKDLALAIRNAYGVLMTRSIRGTVLYSVDPGTRRLFAELGVQKL
ncbi:DNA/RNA helicase domain-containing protein [Amycolatopsis sp. VS8301801F10]|uniref:DNA/RNA helicase domain-containing protein n=1 Tax=Amycolatopsis sp. VS8301801F10 TaxID=2652442 RepID=UPI0038FBFB0E